MLFEWQARQLLANTHDWYGMDQNWFHKTHSSYRIEGKIIEIFFHNQFYSIFRSKEVVNLVENILLKVFMWKSSLQMVISFLTKTAVH